MNIFIIEDNTAYLKQMEFFFKKNITPTPNIYCFPLSEWVNHSVLAVPDVFIIDNFLQTKFSEAKNGLVVQSQFKEKYPNALFIIHSAFDLSKNELSEDFIFFKKSDKSLELIAEKINNL